MRARTFLVPVDGSAASAQAVRLVAAYRGDRSLLSASVLNVQPQPASLFSYLDHAILEQALQEKGRDEAEAANAVLAAEGITTATRVVIGTPAHAILEEAAAQGVDAIVMGTRGLGGIASLALGSVSARVAHGAKTSTVLVKPEARLPREFGRRLRALVPVDGSTHALNAASRLASWSDWLGQVTADVVYIRPTLSLLASIAPPHDDVVAHWGGRANEEATRGARRVFQASGIPHQLHFVDGDPAASIARLADELSADMIVMGTRGLGAAHHAFIGSVSLKVVQLASVPVALLA